MNPGSAHFFGGDLAQRFHQFRVARATEPDVVRIHGGTEHVVVAMHCIDTVQNGNAEPRLAADADQAIDRIGPCLQRIAFDRIGTAAAEHGADEVSGDVGLVLHVAEFGLHHLADFFVERHLRQQRLDLRVFGGERFLRGLCTHRQSMQQHRRCGEHEGGLTEQAAAHDKLLLLFYGPADDPSAATTSTS